MALKITCPHCGDAVRLVEPYPHPGAERQCTCGRALAISYPVGMVEALRRKGALFEDDVLPVATTTGRVVDPFAETTLQSAQAVRTALGGRVPLTSAHTAVPEDPPTVQDHQANATSTTENGPVVRRIHVPARAGEYTSPLVEPERSIPNDKTRGEPAAAPRSSSAGRTSTGREPTAAEKAAGGLAAGGQPQAGKTAGNVRIPPPPRPAQARRRRGSWLVRIAVVGLLGTLGLIFAGILTFYGVGWYYSRDLPTVESLGAYKPPTVTEVYDAKHRLMGEIYDERRYVVPLDRIPAHVQQAFIAAEDANFQTHGGVDYAGIVRAIARNAAKGKKAQGASTITQQVARNFLLTNEKTYARKIKEILLAWRIEDTFDKEHILYLYLNQIYLGSHAYGVEAAARVYFGKHVDELNVSEAAMIAGLPQRPSDYSPHRHFDKARTRQRYVLDQMADNAFLTRAEADAAYDAPVAIVERTNEFLHLAPWFTEYVRKELVAKYGEDKVLNEGLIVETTCDLSLQKVAQEAVTDGVTAVDEKKGWRGADETLAEDEIAPRLAELAKRNEDPLEGERHLGVVSDVQKKHLVVDLGTVKALVPLSWTTWAWTKGGPRPLDDLSRTFHRGDVVTVEIQNADFHDAKALATYTAAGEGPYAAATLFQAPELEGALYSYRMSDGAVVAMVGGVDFKETKFNRAVQAQRQVGSTFKPIVYAAAIASRSFTTGTIVPDAPLVFNTLHSQLWKPENYGESYMGDMTLRRALALSRNVVTIRVLDRLGIDPVYQMARKLGIESPMDQDLSMGLGASSLNIPELSRAYSAFATLGRKVEPHYIDKVTDRDGRVLEAWQPPAQWEQVMDPAVAGIMNWMLVEVATAGTAAKTSQLGLHVGGKTGTTNDNKDVWFVGFTPDLMTTVWVGYDQPRTISANATGGHVALPIWMEYMKVAAPKADDRPFDAAPGVVWATVDEKTGRPMEGGRSMPFLPGTTPTGAMSVAGQKTSEDLLTTEF